MRNPWVNTLLLVLLVLLVGAFVTGFLGLTNGNPDKRWVMWTHSIVGFAVATALTWKVGVVVASLRRRRGLSLQRGMFALLAVLLLLVLACAFIWGLVGRTSSFGYSLLTLHVLLAAVLLAPLLWHIVAMRRVVKLPVARDRRAFLRVMDVTVLGGAVWQASGLAYRALNLPGAARRFTGSYQVGSFSGRFPTVSWLFDRPARVDRETWRLEVVGAVDRPLTTPTTSRHSLSPPPGAVRDPHRLRLNCALTPSRR